jgi:hypothetical protein
LTPAIGKNSAGLRIMMSYFEKDNVEKMIMLIWLAFFCSCNFLAVITALGA